MNQSIFRILCCFGGLLLLPALGTAAPVTLGQSCALTGPTAFLGTEMERGARAYFDKRAAEEVKLITLDDGYDPERCRDNTERFLRDKVDALFGYVGTPTASVALPLAMDKQTVFFGAFTGADFLSDAAAHPYSFSVRASYDQEVENMMRHLKEDLGIKRVGLFVQRDDFGLAGVRAAMRAEKALGGIQIVPALPEIPQEGAAVEEWTNFWKHVPHYRRNTVSVGNGVRQIRGNAVDAIILIGTSRPAALAINQWHKMGFKVPMINISFVGSGALAERLHSTENVFISQVVPDPWNPQIPLVRQYQEDLGTDVKYDFVSLEGYLTAHVMHQALKRVTGAITGDNLKQALLSLSNYDADGIRISFAPNDHRGMDTVYLTKVDKDGESVRFTYVEKLTLEGQ
jgi:branched-chain amino acid transport system substrate-binding protein